MDNGFVFGPHYRHVAINMYTIIHNIANTFQYVNWYVELSPYPNPDLMEREELTSYTSVHGEVPPLNASCPKPINGEPNNPQ
jgi:hypothetical protein